MYNRIFAETGSHNPDHSLSVRSSYGYPGKADLILVNGQFHTVDRENPVAEAVAVRDGKFLEVGTVAEVMQHHCDGTKVVDLKATPPSPA